MKEFEITNILINEDNPQDAEMATRALKKSNLSNTIFTVEDGAEALDFMFCNGTFKERQFQNKPKVVLLDLKLPKVNGLEVLAKIKADPNLKEIPVVVVTSSKDDPDIKEAYRLGANSYVIKPVDFDQFIDSNQNLLYHWLLVNHT